MQSRSKGIVIDIDRYKILQAGDIYHYPIYLLYDDNEARSIFKEPDEVKRIPILVYPSRDRVDFSFD